MPTMEVDNSQANGKWGYSLVPEEGILPTYGLLTYITRLKKDPAPNLNTQKPPHLSSILHLCSPSFGKQGDKI